MNHFWAKVAVAGLDDCWEWTAHRSPKGYGKFKGRHAHRLALTLSGENVPPEAFVCHKCDNPPCCNPDHLYVGDGKTNARDRDERGRASDKSGSANGMARLSAGQIKEIREEFSGSFKRGERSVLAERYGVTGQTIYHVTRGMTWKRGSVGIG